MLTPDQLRTTIAYDMHRDTKVVRFDVLLGNCQMHIDYMIHMSCEGDADYLDTLRERATVELNKSVSEKGFTVRDWKRLPDANP